MLPEERGDDPENPIVPAGVHLAPLWRRAIGLLLDQLLVAGPVIAGMALLHHSPTDVFENNRAGLWAGVAMTSLAVVYETIGVWRWGRTLGKWAMQTRVVHVADGGTVTLSSAFIRSLVPAAFSVVPGIGAVLGFGVYLLAFFDARRQGLHDKAAGTLVGAVSRE